MADFNSDSAPLNFTIVGTGFDPADRTLQTLSPDHIMSSEQTNSETGLDLSTTNLRGSDNSVRLENNSRLYGRRSSDVSLTSSEEDWLEHILQNASELHIPVHSVSPVPVHPTPTEWTKDNVLEQVNTMLDKEQESQLGLTTLTFETNMELDKSDPVDNTLCTGDTSCLNPVHMKEGIFCPQHYHSEQPHLWQIIHTLVMILCYVTTKAGKVCQLECIICADARNYTYLDAYTHVWTVHGHFFGNHFTRKGIDRRIRELILWRKNICPVDIMNICRVCGVATSKFIDSVIHATLHVRADQITRNCLHLFCLCPLYDSTLEVHNRMSHYKTCCKNEYRNLSELLNHLFSSHLYEHMFFLQDLKQWYTVTKNMNACLYWIATTPIMLFVDDYYCNTEWPELNSLALKNLMNSAEFRGTLLEKMFKQDLGLRHFVDKIILRKDSFLLLTTAIARDALALYSLQRVLQDLWEKVRWVNTEVPILESGPKRSCSLHRCVTCKDSADHSRTRDRCIDTRTLLEKGSPNAHELIWQSETANYAAYWVCTGNLCFIKKPKTRYSILNLSVRTKMARIENYYTNGKKSIISKNGNERIYNFNDYLNSVFAALPENCHSPVFIEFLDNKKSLNTEESIYFGVSAYLNSIWNLREQYCIPICILGPIPQYTWDMSPVERELEETRCVYLTNTIFTMSSRLNLMFLPLLGTIMSFRRKDIYPPQWCTYTHWVDEPLFNPEGPSNPTREFSIRLGTMVDKVIETIAYSNKRLPYKSQYERNMAGPSRFWYHSMEYMQNP